MNTDKLPMLTTEEIQRLLQQLIEDINQFKLTGNDIQEQIYLYLENIPSLEFVDDAFLYKTVLTIVQHLPVQNDVCQN